MINFYINGIQKYLKPHLHFIRILSRIMSFRVFLFLSVVTFVAGGGDWHPKPKTTTTTEEPTTTTTEEPTTPIWTIRTVSPTRPPPKCPPILPPIQPTTNSVCCGQNEVYLPPRIAPNCDVYCKDIGKKCQIRYDRDSIFEPHGCYCLPGYCRNKYGKCIPFCDAFTECF
ncbi:uncharacterized protein LOC129911184 [Episyrphus balteatus]|uniref:uncharacterized protein LOC129911184 n=1 Tax=Episyrphus balteatus TaxID=286459 RepID=UPI00248581DF|nr:uncharacterized protein LOC129911184 [Episyrphus balteatus]